MDSFRPCKRGGVFSHPYLYEKPPHEGGGLVRSDAARVEYLVDLIRFRHQPCGEVFLDIKGIPWVRVRQILIIGVTGDVVLIREEGAHTSKLQDALAAVQHRQLIYRGKVFATLSSDEFKKTAAAKKNLCGCRSNWRLEAKKSPVVPGK